MNFKNNKSGITLVALVITIIILLIFAGISISTLTQTGLLGKAKLTEQKSEEAKQNQIATLEEYENKIQEHLISTRDENSEHLKNESLLDISSYSINDISIYDNRLTNIQGGYKLDGNIVHIFIKATSVKALTSSVGSWLLLYNLPEPKEGSAILNAAAYNTSGELLDDVRSSGIFKKNEKFYLSFFGTLRQGSIITIQGSYLKK